MDAKSDNRSFFIAFSKTASKLTALFFLGLFVAMQIVFSPIIDNSIESFLRSSVGLEIPRELEMIPFKSVLLFWLIILSIFIFIRYIKAVVIWLIDRKEKVIITSILLSTQLVALTPGRIEISDFVVLAVLSVWFLHIFMNKEYKITWSPSYILILLFLLSVLLSFFNGKSLSLIRLFSVTKTIIVFFIMVNIIRDRETAIFSLKIYLLLATFSAIIGILQEIIFFYSGIPLVGFIPEDIRDFMWEMTSLGKLMRVPAFTGWYLNLDYFLLTSLVIGVNLLFYSVFKGKKERLFLYIAMLLMSIAFYLTFSNSSMIVLLLIIIISIFIRWRSLSIHFITIFLAGILIAYLSGLLTNFIEEPEKYILTEDVRIRIDLLRDGLIGFFNRHPFIGNGIGTGNRYTSNVDLWGAHNMVVLIADELGLLGILTYGAFFFVFIYRQVISILRLKDRNDKAVSLSLLIALIAYIASMQFQSLYFNFFLFLYLGLMEGINRTLSYQAPFESNVKA